MKKAPKTYETYKGKYRVRYYEGLEAHIDLRDKINPDQYNTQNVIIDDVEDLKDLFVAIASVLNQVYDDDNFK